MTSKDYEDDYKNEVNAFLTKIENSWIGRRVRRGRRTPLYAPDTRNYFDALSKLTKESSNSNLTMTNNMVKGLNSAFAPNVPKNATVWSVIICFQKEDMITCLKYNESLTGEESSHNKKRKLDNVEKMFSLAEIGHSYPEFEDKSMFIDILLRH